MRSFSILLVYLIGRKVFFDNVVAGFSAVPPSDAGTGKQRSSCIPFYLNERVTTSVRDSFNEDEILPGGEEQYKKQDDLVQQMEKKSQKMLEILKATTTLDDVPFADKEKDYDDMNVLENFNESSDIATTTTTTSSSSTTTANTKTKDDEKIEIFFNALSDVAKDVTRDLFNGLLGKSSRQQKLKNKLDKTQDKILSKTSKEDIVNTTTTSRKKKAKDEDIELTRQVIANFFDSSDDSSEQSMTDLSLQEEAPTISNSLSVSTVRRTSTVTIELPQQQQGKDEEFVRPTTTTTTTTPPVKKKEPVIPVQPVVYIPSNNEDIGINKEPLHFKSQEENEGLRRRQVIISNDINGDIQQQQQVSETTDIINPPASSPRKAWPKEGTQHHQQEEATSLSLQPDESFFSNGSSSSSNRSPSSNNRLGGQTENWWENPNPNSSWWDEDNR